MRTKVVSPGPSEDAVGPVRPDQDAADRPGSRWKRKSLFSLIGVLAGTSLALLLGEILVRALGITPETNIVYRENFRLSDNPVLQYELMPGSRDGRYVINSAGMRDREFPLRKPEGVFRIAVVGDSVTYGFHLPRTRSYPRLLEVLLNRSAMPASPRFEVLNLGVTGYNITQIVEAVRVRGLPYQPDLIVYGYVLNDPQFFTLEGEALRSLRAQGEARRQTLSRRLGRILSHSKLFLLARQRLGTLPAEVPPELQEPVFAAADTGSHYAYLRLLHERSDSWERVRTGMADLAQLMNRPPHIPVLVTMFPIACPEGYEHYPLRKVHAQVMAEAECNGLHTLDLTASFGLVERDFGHRCFFELLHPSRWGHLAAASGLLRWLAESGVLPEDCLSLERLLTEPSLDPVSAAILRHQSQSD